MDELRNQFNTRLFNHLNKIKNPKIKEIVEHSLIGGKRLRPLIILDISQSLGNINEDVFLYSIAIEYLHTASLIIDDMPFMDNDDFRRGRKTVHNKYGICKANLIYSFLISESFNLVNQSIKNKNEKITEYLINKLCLETRYASLGQFYDLNECKNDMYKNFSLKTKPFFSLAFIGSYILSGGDFSKLEYLEEISKSFSIAFQICDDFEDEEQDKNNDLKPMNYVLKYGKKVAFQYYNKEIENFKKNLNILSINSSFFDNLIQYLNNKIKVKVKSL